MINLNIIKRAEYENFQIQRKIEVSHFLYKGTIEVCISISRTLHGIRTDKL